MNVSDIKYSKVSPAFLTANSTSHTWPFSAIAELIDNAYDPDVNATQINIEIRTIQNEKCLVFLDNGSGLNPDCLYKMLSFGFSDKPEIKGHLPIGHYGNGFKSGSMRLGKDAIVFTCRCGIASVGLLSQTYLAAINVETVLVPIVSWKLPNFKLIASANNEQVMKSNLDHITKYSLFKSKHVLQAELEEISKSSNSGTKIIIYNLKRDSRGVYELDTESTQSDILNPETVELDRTNMIRPVAQVIPTYRKSLKEYCSILYLKPRIKIHLRGQKIKNTLIAKSLFETEYDSYKPSWLNRPIKMILGVSRSNNREDYGAMMYHRNRLIKAYERVGFQSRINTGLGVGVVAVVEVDFLQPIHNKQDFHKDEKYNAFMHRLAEKMNLYYNVKTDQADTNSATPVKTPWNWAQCDQCLKWRRLMDFVDQQNLPEKWFCYLNEDATHNRCDIEEEPEDEDDVLMNRGSYSKKYRKQQDDLKRRVKEDEDRQKQQRELELRQREALLDQREKGVGKINLVKARKALELARKKDRQQSELISQLQQEKEAMEQQRKQMLELAENLAKRTLKTSDSQPESEESPQAKKRRPNGKVSKRQKRQLEPVCIKTEDGAILVVTENNYDESVIDLTNDDDPSQEISVEPQTINGDKSHETTTESDVENVAPSTSKHALQNHSNRVVDKHTKQVDVTDIISKTVESPVINHDPHMPVVYKGPKTKNTDKSTEQSNDSSRSHTSKSSPSKSNKMVVKIFGKKPTTEEETVDVKPDLDGLNAQMAGNGDEVQNADPVANSELDISNVSVQNDEQMSNVGRLGNSPLTRDQGATANDAVDTNNVEIDRVMDNNVPMDTDRQTNAQTEISQSHNIVENVTTNKETSSRPSGDRQDTIGPTKNKNTSTPLRTKYKASKPSLVEISSQTDPCTSENSQVVNHNGIDTNNADLQKRIDDLRKELKEHGTTNKNLEERLQENESTIENLKEELQEKAESTEKIERNLRNLRTEVIELLHIIVPDIEIRNVDKVDDFVKEIIRVNKGESSGEGIDPSLLNGGV